MNTSKLNLQDAIDFEVVSIYLRQSRIAVYCTLILTLYLALSFYQVTDMQNIMLWLAIVFSVNAYIVYTSFQFNESLPVYKISFFRNRQHFLHALGGVAWGLAFVFLLDSETPQSGDYRVAMVLGIVIAFAASTKAASLRGLVSYVMPIGILASVHFFSNFTYFAWWFFGLVGLVAVSLFFGWMTNKYILGQIESSVLNTGYIDELRALNTKIETTNQDFVKRNLELQDIQKQLQALAAHDALTGLYNRRYILERIEEKLPEIRRHQLDCCFVMLDVDYFKDVNDRFGHLAGDDVLKTVAHILAAGVRQGDIVARYGGEEFLIFLPMTELASAQVLVERLRLALEQHTHHLDGEDLTVTASFGIAQHGIQDSADKTIGFADKALYQAKVAGRNYVATAPSPES